MNKKLLKTSNVNYYASFMKPALAFLCIAMFAFANTASAQKDKSKNKSGGAANSGTTISNGASEGMKSNPTSDQIMTEEEFNKKLDAIDKSIELSPEQKESMKQELYKSAKRMKSNKSAGFSLENISLRPKYFPAKAYNDYKSVVDGNFPGASRNLLVINEVLAADFNIHNNEFGKKLEEIILNNALTEEEAAKYILPNLQKHKTISTADNGSIIKMLQLYFATQPELYQMLPSSIIEKMKDEDGIETIIKMQK